MVQRSFFQTTNLNTTINFFTDTVRKIYQTELNKTISNQPYKDL